MPAELFGRIADECAAHDTALWLHFLGEPLLHRELFELIRRARGAGVRQIGLSTNAVSLHGPRIDALLDTGLDRLECSVDADDRDGYLAMRGRDHHERVVRNVRAFLERKSARGLERPITSIQFMRTPEVEARLAELVDAWRPWLGPRDFVMTIAPASFGGAIVEAGRASDAGPRPPCAWLFSSLMVLQDGTVTMCGADWDARAPLGNLRDDTLAGIWHGAEAERRRRAHRAGRFGEVSPCTHCQDWRLADGSGYANALVEVDAARAAARGAA